MGEGVNPVKLFQVMDTLLTERSVLVADGGQSFLLNSLPGFVVAVQQQQI